VEAAAELIDRPGVAVPPRKQWPSGMKELGVPVAGRIPAGELAEEGRVIGRLSDTGWGTRLRALLADPDAPVPTDVLDACVRVLAGWGWAERPVGVVGVGSRRRPGQLAHLAGRIAEIGRLPLLGTLAPAGDGPGGQRNSAQRLAAVWDGFDAAALPDLSSAHGPILLVDDLIDSGWTMTVAARSVRASGAHSVLPFALALAG
jgi:ATP-dependent DNA helicase RecQ